MRPVLSIAIAICFLPSSFAYGQNNSGGGLQPTIGSGAARRTPAIGGNAGAAPTSPTIGAGAALNAHANAKKAAEEIEISAKEKYTEIFAPKATYEVRLRNKALALKKGRLLGTTKKNSFVVFESRRLIVAVPADSLNKKLANKVADRLEKAKAVFTETGLAYEEVLEVPETGEEKTVGLANREKITIFIHKKPKADAKKKAESEKKTETDKGKPGKAETEKTEADKAEAKTTGSKN